MVLNIGNALSAYRQAMGGSASTGASQSVSAGGDSFADTLQGFLGDAVKTLKDGEQAAAAGVAGKASLQEVVLAVNNAETMLQTVTAIRDKVVSAYQDIMRTSV